jgi:hypothetical protein
VVLDGAATTTGIRSWAARILPDYMVPSTVTVLPELPLTANGKFDVTRLPAPALAADTAPGAIADSEQTGLCDATESMGIIETMTRVWRSIFGTVVTPDDDFFELGGNSLLAVRLIAEHHSAGLRGITIPDLYRWPTIANLAQRLADPPT